MLMPTVTSSISRTGSGQQNSGKIDFCDQRSVADQAVPRLPERAGKIRPGNQRRVKEKGIRNAAAGNVGHPSEEKRENEHCKERLDDRPGRAKGGLLITHLDVAPSEEVKQLAEMPKFGRPFPFGRADFFSMLRDWRTPLLFLDHHTSFRQ